MRNVLRSWIGAAMLAGLAAAAVTAVGAASNPTNAPAPMGASSGLSRAQMESFIVQSAGAMADGAAAGPLQGIDDPVVWRKHDWANRDDQTNRRAGYQASDSVVEDLAGGRLYVQTFDFGDGKRRFQHFDLHQGDGGQALAIVNGSAYAILTEDGGGGVQWFIGAGCRTSAKAQAPFKSWLFFDRNVTSGAWRDRVARLNIEPRESDCPLFFNDAYTRWRRLNVHFPYRVSAPGQKTREGTWKVDTILSEHYGGSSIAAARHLERFWFGRGYGLLRWERWENAGLTSRAHVRDDAQMLAASGRCGLVEGSKPPGAGWLMVDCRTWTNFVRLAKPWRVGKFNWPRRNALDQIAAVFQRR